MIKHKYFIPALAVIFVLLSVIFYVVHYFVFHDVHHILIFMVGDLAFLPLEVFIVVLVIERILGRREKQAKLQKLNMVVGAFFSDVGNYLLRNLIEQFDNKQEISHHLNISSSWTNKDFRKASYFAHQLPIDINCRRLDLDKLKEFLSQKRVFILTLLENPSLLENDRFTDLLWAVTHLDEELEARPSLNNLSDNDLNHIAGDIKRMYDHLASEWLIYTEHLKSRYPYLFSLSLRNHPFQNNPSASIS
ncbi:hypothetical protein ACFLXC_01045 [Chloroflexota bacterium]